MSQERPKVSRRRLLGGAAATTALGALPVTTATTAPTDGRPRDESAELRRQWAAAGGSHPLVPDVSHAGYRQGARPSCPRVVARVTDFGAQPDGTTDSAQAFNDAVRYAGAGGGGTVVVPPGTYVLSLPVWLHWSNVVLRGAGRDQTVLHFTRPLQESYRPNLQSSGNSR